MPTIESSEDIQRLRDAVDATQASKANLEQEVARLRDELHTVKAEASKNVRVSLTLNGRRTD